MHRFSNNIFLQLYRSSLYLSDEKHLPDEAFPHANLLLYLAEHNRAKAFLPLVFSE